MNPMPNHCVECDKPILEGVVCGRCQEVLDGRMCPTCNQIDNCLCEKGGEMLVEAHNPEEDRVRNVLNALWTIEEGLRAYNADKIYAYHIDLVKQYIKGQRDTLNQQQER